MPINDSYLFDAGWLFFAVWGLVVATVSVAAFGRDLFHSRARLEPELEARPSNSAQSGESGAH